MAETLQILVEAERRGIDMEPADVEVLAEARRRGMVPGGPTPSAEPGDVRSMLNTFLSAFSGEPLLPSGPRMNPIAEATKLPIPFALQTAGGAVGQRLAGPAGAGVLSGTGAVLGRDINAALDLEPPLDLKDRLATFALGALGEAGARYFMQTPGAATEGQRRLRAFQAQSVSPKITDVTEARGPAVLERAVVQTPFGGGIISRKFGTQAKQLSAAAEDYLIEHMGPSKDAVAIGWNTRSAVETEKARTSVIANSRYAEVRRLAEGRPAPTQAQVRGELPAATGETVLPSGRTPFGGRVPTQEESVGRTLQAAKAQITGQPFSETNPLMSQARPPIAEPFATGQVQRLGTVEVSPTPGPVRVQPSGLAKAARELLAEEMEKPVARDRDTAFIARVKDYLSLVDKGAMRWSQADALRRVFGDNSERWQLLAPRQIGAERRLHAAIARDMETAAESSGNPALLTAWRDARAYWEHRAAVLRDSKVSQILKTSPEKVVAMLDLKSGPTAISNAKEAINDPAAWNAIRRHVLEGVFRDAVDERAKGVFGEVISDARLAAQEKKFGPGAFATLLETSEARAAFDELRLIAKSIRSGERLGSVPQSATFQNFAIGGMLSGAGATVGTAAGYAVGGGPVGAAVGATVGTTLSLLVIPPIAAKILTSERAARLVASPSFAKVATDLRLGGRLSAESAAAVGRLGALILSEQSSGGGDLSPYAR